MSKYTPGPWAIGTSDERGIRCVDANDPHGDGIIEICEVFGVHVEMSRANARLIAAAPDLVECITMGATMQTPEFLEWLADRLVTVYGEDPGVNFVVSLRDRARQMCAARLLALGEQ